MATLAYCIKKMGKGFDPGIAKHLRDLSQDYQDMDMSKKESEIMAVQDVLKMLDKEYNRIVDQIEPKIKEEISRVNTAKEVEIAKKNKEIAKENKETAKKKEQIERDAKSLPKYYRMADGRIVHVIHSKSHDNKFALYAAPLKSFTEGKRGNRLKIKKKTLFDTEGEAVVALAKYAESRNYVPIKPSFGGKFVEATPKAIKARADAMRTITKGIEYGYWGIQKESKAGKFLSGEVDISDLTPKSFTVNELRGLARLFGTAETGTKDEIYSRVLKGLEL